MMVWDSMFFGRIAQAGYEYEQFYAFFPLFPFLVRVLVALGAPRDASLLCSSAYASACRATKLLSGAAVQGMALLRACLWKCGLP